MIERVHLRDFKSHEETVVTFHPGANALLGQNGAGKTSILQAIGLCLFDVGPSRQSEWHRKGTDGGRATVTFRAPSDGQRYSVERRVGTSGARLLDGGGTVLATGKADVYTGVRDLLGLDPAEDLPRLWTELVGVPQGLLTAAFRLTPTRRREVFDAILRVDEYRDAFDRLKPTAAHAAGRVAEARARRDRLSGMLEGAEANRAALTEVDGQVAQHAENLARTEADAKAADATLDGLRRRQQAARAIRDAAAEADNRRSRATQARDHARAAVAESEKAAAWLVQHRERVEAVEAAEAFLERESAAVAAAREALAEQARLEKETPALEARLERDRTALESLRKQVAEAPDLERVRPEAERLAARMPALETEAKQTQDRLAEAERVVQEARRTTGEQERLEADAARAATLRRGDGAQQALHAAEAEAEGTRRLADALDAQFDALARTRTCPILDLSCPVAGADLGDKREARRGELDTRLSALEAELPELRRAAEAERAANAWLDAWAEREPRLGALRALADEARRLEAKTLPDLRAAAEAARATLAEAGAERQRLEALLATQGHIDPLRDAVRRQETVLAEDEARLQSLRNRMAEIAAGREAHAEVDRRARAAETLRRREVGFVRELAVQRSTADSLAERAARLEAAEAAHAETAGEAQRTRTAADEAWGRTDDDALADAERSARDARDAWTRTQAEAAALERRRHEAAARVGRDEETARELATAEEALAEALRVEGLVRRVRGLIRDLGPHVAERYVERISVAADEHFRDLTGGRPVRLVWDRDYEVCVTDADGHVRTFADLSGGEQVMAALAVRLSLLRSLSPLPFAVYDEPTINLDAEVRLNVARVLEGAGQKQIIVVSHDDAFSESIHNAIRLEKRGTRSHLVEQVHA